MRTMPLHQRFTPAPLAQAAFLALAMAAGHAPLAHAQSGTATAVATPIALTIPALPLGQALNELARQANLAMTFPAALVAGKQAPAVTGPLTVQQALDRLLAGSRLTAAVEGHSVIVKELPAGAVALKEMPTVRVVASVLRPGDLPAAFAGGQVATGARMGVLGNQSVMDTPANITSYTAELMENRHARTVADVLTSDPSVRNSVTTGHQYENFKVRGFTISRGDFAIDGLFGMSGNSNSAIDMFERVELLKGPGVLFTGMAPSGGVGGIINMVPKRASDEPINRVTVDAQSASQLGTSVDVGRRFGEDKALGLRINGRFADGETTLQGQDERRESFSVALDYRGKALKASLDAYTSKEVVTGGVGAMFEFPTNAVVPAAPDPSINQFPSANGVLESNAVIARAEYDILPGFSAFAATGLSKSKNAGFTGGSIVNAISASGTSTTTTTGATLGSQTNRSTEAGLRGRLTTGPVLHDLVLQVSRLENETRSASVTKAIASTNIYNPTYADMPVMPTFAPKTAQTTWSGLTLADTLSTWNDKLHLTLAMRRQRIETTSFSATGAVTADYDMSAWAPSVGVVVKPWGDHLSLYANHVQALSKGDQVTQVAGYVQDFTFEPYKSTQHELGVKWNLGSFAHTVSLFQISQPMLIATGVRPNMIATINGEKRVRGLEWNSFGTVMPHVRLLGGVAYTEGVQTRTQGGQYDGKDAVGVPQWQGNLSAEWDTPWVPGLTFSGQVTTTSSQYLDSANVMTLPSWTVLDLGARYSMQVAGKKLTTRLTVSNASDRHYYSSSFRDTRPVANLGQGRVVSVSATLDF
ncbi:TonB-dependent siderophore receptor [Aquabacterium sp. OR-4]|uniref:TonB-dependent siderophore receptor n=1 Tax=Aquabacterium sp. OR-4 TaxID=2978127 RepID=UPI0021B2131D|nr:TonB-dependent receptor [Aquabacterium sp. OR-4]MDT7835349.1 TonB-dependent receptor [Aquabacterium sp. OR-4]